MLGSLDVPSMLHDLVQQQTALGQQQAALLQLQTELVRLQRLLVERAVGVPTTDVTPVVAMPPTNGMPPADTSKPQEAPRATDAASASVRPETSIPGRSQGLSSAEQEQPTDSPVGESPPLRLVSQSAVPGAAPVHPTGVSPTLRATRYLQPPAPKPARPVTRQDVDRVTRLYETGDAAHLVLQFGEYKDCTLLQVAQTDPDYVRRLALTAQRPQMRAAARQVAAALEAAAAGKPRTARTADRRSRPAG